MLHRDPSIPVTYMAFDVLALDDEPTLGCRTSNGPRCSRHSSPTARRRRPLGARAVRARLARGNPPGGAAAGLPAESGASAFLLTPLPLAERDFAVPSLPLLERPVDVWEPETPSVARLDPPFRETAE